MDVNDSEQFVEPADPNAIWLDGHYHLLSGAGRWHSLTNAWIIDDVNSPAIDAGDPLIGK